MNGTTRAYPPPPVGPGGLAMFGHPALRQAARDIRTDELTPGSKITQLAERLEVIIREWGGVGIAAPQLAMGVRVVVIAPPRKQPLVLVNPTVDEDIALGYDDPDLDHGGEGCLSVPHTGFPIRRHRTLHVHTLDLDGNPIAYEAHGFEARIVAHELDHLDGVLIVDRASDEARRRFLRDWRHQLLATHSALVLNRGGKR